MRLGDSAPVRLFHNASDTLFDFIDQTALGATLFRWARIAIFGLGIVVIGKIAAGQALSFQFSDLLFIASAFTVFMVVAWRWEIGIAMVPGTTCFIFDAGVIPTLSPYHFVPEIQWLEPYRLLLGQGIMLFMLAFIVFSHQAKTVRDRLSTPMTVTVLLFMLSILVSSVYGVVFDDVHLPYMVEAARPFSYYLMFIVTLLCLRTRTAMVALLTTIMVMAVIVGAGMALQFFSGDRVRIFIGDFRVESFGRYAGRVLPPGQSLVWLAIPTLIAAAGSVRKSLRPWLVGALTVVSIGLLLAFTRAMWVGTLAGLAMMLLLGNVMERRGISRIALAFAGAIAVILLILGTLSTDSEDYMGAYVERFTSMFRTDTYASETTFDARVQEIRAAWEKVIQHPWLGIGLGAYYDYDLQWNQETNSFAWKGISYIHNVYMYILCKAGAIGLVTLLSMCVTFFVRAVKIHRMLTDRLDRALVLGAVGSTLSCMVGSLMQPSMALEGPVTLLGILWGVTEYLRWAAQRGKMPVRAAARAAWPPGTPG